MKTFFEILAVIAFGLASTLVIPTALEDDLRYDQRDILHPFFVIEN